MLSNFFTILLFLISYNLSAYDTTNQKKPLEETLCELFSVLVNNTNTETGEFLGPKSDYELIKKKIFKITKEISYKTNSKYIECRVYGEELTDWEDFNIVMAKNCPAFKKAYASHLK
tara:strand:+ start:225 stop:575 length:351 start_codon:yes stop_codon:yes gene_type:complete